MFRESALAHSLLDNLGGIGIEIGAAYHNPFGIPGMLYTGLNEEFYRTSEIQTSGTWRKLDVITRGEVLPFADNSLSYVLTSHVLEHFADPIGVLREWWRVIRPGGIIFAIVPHKERTFDANRERTTLAELIARNKTGIYPDSDRLGEHFSVWITSDMVELMAYLQYPVIALQDVDDKVGNGFAIAVQKGGKHMENMNVLDAQYKTPDPWGFQSHPDDAMRKARILELLKPYGPFVNALDIGAGEGWITKDLPAKHLFGFEGSDTAASRFPHNVTRVLDPENSKYDLIVATGVMYTQYDPARFLDIIKKSATHIVLVSSIKSLEVPDVAQLATVGKLLHSEEFQYREYVQHLRIFEFGQAEPVEEEKAAEVEKPVVKPEPVLKPKSEPPAPAAKKKNDPAA